MTPGLQPDLIVETSITHGGSPIFSASMQELIAVCGGLLDAETPGAGPASAPATARRSRRSMFKYISMIECSSIAPEIIEQVKAKAAGKQRVLVSLDSNHTHAQVLAELEAYAPLTTAGSNSKSTRAFNTSC